jgi:hypothetical protein
MCEVSWRTVVSSGRSRLMRHHRVLIHRDSRRVLLRNQVSGTADSRKFKRLKTPQVACARELEPPPLDTQALPVWRYALILHCGEGGAQIAL